MRHRGLRGSFFASHAGISGLSKSTGQFVTADKSTPAIPAGLQALAGQTNTELNISWNAVAGVSQYQLYREGVLIARTGDTFFFDSGLVPANPYIYNIQSLSLSGVESPLSSDVTGTPV